MELWKSTVLALLTLSVAVGLFRLFGEKHLYEKQVQFLFSLLCIAMIAVPLSKMGFTFSSRLPVIDWSGDTAYQDQWDQVLLSETKERITGEVEALLSDRFDLYPWDATVSVDLLVYGQRVYFDGIELSLTLENAYMEQDIQRYLEKQLDCTVKVKVIQEENSHG